MNLKGIISIAGKPGLFKVISQSKNSLIVESLIDKKRFPAFAANKISALDEISMYTVDEDVPLGDIIQKIYEKEKGAVCIDAKEEPSAHHAYFESILPNYDKERVYNSDLKKLYSWYNLLHGAGELTRILEETKKAEAEAKKEEKKSSKKEKVEAAVDSSEEKKEVKAKKTKTTEKKKTTANTPGTKIKAESKAKNTVRTASTKRGA